MTAYLQSKGIWCIVSGAKTQPLLSDIPTAGEQAVLKLYHENCDKAWGMIYLHLDNDQKIHVEAVKDDPIQMWEALKANRDKACGMIYLHLDNDQKIHVEAVKDDPIQMWEALKAVHQQKRPGNRFNAYDDLFSIQKEEGENLQTLINRVEQAVLLIQQLRLKDFDLAKACISHID
ncbi:hypothetical protein CVT25_004115 [Psilocybe cyanescens]|uniref:Uncharacterized protein n=1 Tax=Psilocybe cyanescens TaxID=93625 RepID=A0A409XRF2_PSICY|nr:hypothetical protein CVT25_004115 [Psilocybe cyanescens]